MANPRLHRQARRLLDQLRAGTLTRDQLRLAAWARDPVSELALGPDAPKLSDDLEVWSAGFFEWGVEAVVRVWVALTAAHMDHEGAKRRPAERTLEAVKDWVLDPTPKHGLEARKAAEALSYGHSRSHRIGQGFYKHADDTNSMEMAHYLGLAVEKPTEWLLPPTGPLEEPSGTILGPPYDLFRGAVRASVKTLGADGVCDAIRAGLVPWALGHQDPLDD